MAGILNKTFMVGVPGEDDSLIDVRAVCAMIGRGKSKTYALLNEGRLPAPVVREPKYTRWRRGDIIKYLKGIGQ